ncbi:MAG TPA: cold shock domain-containing protein [Candidatus Paceibacterota bacterium]|nr:cold shock domain-containing protein [Candidatus Paceibacterota bacterium]
MNTVSETFSGRLKWYNKEKSYGFAVVDGRDVLLHASVLKRSGVDPAQLREGELLNLEIERTSDGRLRAARVSILDGTLGAQIAVGRSVQNEGFERATVERFEKKFGFLELDRGGKAFIGAWTLKKCGINNLKQGQRVLVRIEQAQKGPAATDIRLGA